MLASTLSDNYYFSKSSTSISNSVNSINSSLELAQTFSSKDLKSKISNFKMPGIKLRTDSEFLERFLSVSGLDENGNEKIESAFNVYKNYYSCLMSLNYLNPNKPEFNFQHNLKVLLQFIETPSGNPLHFYGFDSKNRAVLGYISSQVDPRSPDVLLGQLLASLVIVEYLQTKFSKKIKQNGMIMVMDHGGLTMAHYQKFITNPFMLKLFADFYSTAIPIAIHEQAVINEARITNLLFLLARPFISYEMTEKLKFYGDNYSAVIEELGGLEFAPEFLEGGMLKAKTWPDSDVLENCLKKSLPEKAVFNEF